MGNRLIYPIPKCSYQDNKEDPTLIYIPHAKGRSSTIPNSSSPELKEKENKKIPCRFIQCQAEASPYLMIYFHANSEDLGYDLSYLLSKFEERFGMNILCPEYPTYGIYKKKEDGLDMDQAIYEDAIKVMQYCNNTLKFEYKNIILVGRSLGTGIVARLASEFSVRGAILISPFTSIRDVAKHLVGNLLSRLAPDVFKSIDYMDKLKSPVLFIHGKEDALIPCEMSVKLHEKVVVEIKEIVINEKMSHNQFKIEPDVFSPMSNFIQEKLDLGEHMSKVLDRYYDLYG